MPEKLRELFDKYSTTVGLYEGDSLTIIEENDFEDIINDIINLYKK